MQDGVHLPRPSNLIRGEMLSGEVIVVEMRLGGIGWVFVRFLFLFRRLGPCSGWGTFMEMDEI